jgi:hypothetical protein
VQCTLGLGDDRRGHPGRADEQNRVQCVTQSTEILALTF